MLPLCFGLLILQFKMLSPLSQEKKKKKALNIPLLQLGNRDTPKK